MCRRPLLRPREACWPYLNCGIVGTLRRGGGGAANREALPIPLGSTTALFNPPAFAGPRAMPLIGTFPVPPDPGLRANRANEAAGATRISNTAKPIFTEELGMERVHDN